MYKGQRPSIHRRVVRTRRGLKPVLVNPSIKKLTHHQYIAIKKTKLNGDADRDGVKNRKDCRPFDPRRQDENDRTSDEIIEQTERKGLRKEALTDEEWDSYRKAWVTKMGITDKTKW